MSDHVMGTSESPGAGDLNTADMWIKQHDTEAERKVAKNSDYSCLALRQVSQPQVVNLFGSPCQKSPELHRID